MKKKIILFLNLIILIIPIVLADIGDVFDTGGDLLGALGNNLDVTIFFLSFALFFTAGWIGATTFGKDRGWTPNAIIGLGVIVGLVGSIPLTFFLTRSGFDLVAVLGPFFVILAMVIIFIILSFFLYKSGGNMKKATPYIVALAVIILNGLFIKFYPTLMDDLGSWGDFISVIVFLAGAFLVISILRYVWDLFTGLKAKKPLSDEDYAGTVKAIKQKRGIGAQKAVSKAKKKERSVRRDLRQISRKVRQAAEILGSLHQAVAQEKPKLIKGDWKKWQGELKKLEKLKVKISAYAALVSKVLAETEDLPVSPSLKKKLEVYENDILAETKHLEDNVADVTKNIQKIDEKTAPGDPLWNNIIVAIKNASDSFSKILRDGEAGLALEQRVREDLGRE